MILVDTPKSKKIQIDDSKVLNHLIHMENKFVELLKRLKEKQETSDKVYNELYPTDSKPGILYSLCEIHRSIFDVVPCLCSILSAIGTPTYKLLTISYTIKRTTNVKTVHYHNFIFVL